MQSDELSLPDGDLLEGADEIAEFLRSPGLKDATRQRAFRLCATKQIPSGKLGSGLIGSKRAIRRRFAQLIAA